MIRMGSMGGISSPGANAALAGQSNDGISTTNSIISFGVASYETGYTTSGQTLDHELDLDLDLLLVLNR